MTALNRENTNKTAIGLAVVSLLAVFLSLGSIFSMWHMQKTASRIYDHPYIVSNEARAMRSRLLDMRGFIIMMMTDPDRDTDTLHQTLENRYAMQHESIDVIRDRYLGPSADVDALTDAMHALEEAQVQAITYAMQHTEEEIAAYIEDTLYPRYDAVNDGLMTIIAFADRKVQSLEQTAAQTASLAILSAAVLTIFLPLYFLFMFRKERKNTREIRYRERLFDILSTNVDDVFFIYNAQRGALEYISANVERILGVSSQDFERNTDVLIQRTVPEDRDAFRTFLQGDHWENARSLNVRLLSVPGDIRWMKIQVYPEMEGDKTVRYILSMTDQTESMNIQQTLQDALVNAQNANAAKQNFLSRMSHEIRTPMNAIIGMTTIAAAYIEDRKRVEDCLQKIGYSSKHLMTLINDVLDMSKIDEGKMHISHEVFQLESVAESITSIIYPQAVEKGLTFTMPLVDLTDTVLVGDPLRLNQVLLNLLSNALKFTPEGGAVRMEIRQLQRKAGRVRLRFTISDTGIGMSEAFLEHLFLPFEQESVSGAQKYGGTGLGMSITKNLVTLMGGTITVKSEQERGTAFTVELDFDIPESDEQLPQRQQTLDALKVLVADDDEDSCVHTSLLLKNLGILSDWVLAGRECIETVRQAHKNGEDYDVCLIDWKMPDLDGIEVTRRLREFVGPDTLIIIITAYDWSGIEQSAREAGANAFLSKPIFASTLYNTLLSVAGVDRAAHSDPSDPLGRRPELAGRHVLLVEDNVINQEIAMELLSMADMIVDCANNGQEAVDKFLADGDRYDAILMDVQMPILDGYQATETIRKSGHPRAKTIPIIAMTADAFHEDVVKATGAGMNGHMAKPIEASLLYSTLAEQICRIPQ